MAEQSSVARAGHSPEAPAAQPAPAHLVRIAAAVVPEDTSAVQVGVIAPGGYGASELLAAIADRLTKGDSEPHGAAPLSMVGRRLEAAHRFGALASCMDIGTTVGHTSDGAQIEDDPRTERRCRERLLERLQDERTALLVDEAQWLDDATLRVLVGTVERAADRDVTVIAAHRPVPGHPALAALDAALSRYRSLVRLEPLGPEDVAKRAALLLGGSVDAAFARALYEQSAGIPALVDRLAMSWAATAQSVGAGAQGPSVPPDVIENVRIETDQLPPASRTLLVALSSGADPDDELLGHVTGLSPSELDAAIEALDAAGLLAPGTHVPVPVVAMAVSELTPTADRRRFDASLAEARAVTAARRAEAAALDGDADLALRLADSVARDPATPERERALGVIAALLPARGFWHRSAEAYKKLEVGETLGPDEGSDHDPPTDAAKLLGLIGSVVGGAVPDGASDQPAGERFQSMLEPVSASISLELEALRVAARGLVASLDQEVDGVESSFLEAAELLEAAHARLLLPDTPHALGATIALALCELTTADHLLSRALEHDVGGRALHLRHRLLLGWVAVRSGRWSAAQAALDETRDQPMAPRELLFANAIDAGLARRAGDLPRMTDAWRRAEGVLLRHSPDLMSLDAIGELTITASRLGHWDRVAGKARQLGDVVRALGEPPLWLLPLRWIGLQVALASDDHDAVQRRAAEIGAIDPVHRRLGALAEAARLWGAILEGRVEPPEVDAASRGLQSLGLTWEASRLTGQAAIRSSDPSVTRALLERARDLRSTLPTAEVDPAPTAANVLSEREQVVAQHIVDGLAYKEIGALLFISPKTVEHHVAKIRQKLGATTRAEMLAALRSMMRSE